MPFTNKEILPVVIGAGGDLMRKKFALALLAVYRSWKRIGTRFPEKILATDVKLERISGLPQILRSALDNCGEEISSDDANDFMRRFVAVHTTTDGGELIKAIRTAMKAQPESVILPYLAVPYDKNCQILESFSPLRDLGLGGKIYPTFEKPAALTMDQMTEIRRLLLTIGIDANNACITEHFILKHGFLQLLQFMYGNKTNNDSLNYKGVKRVRIIVREELGGDERAYWGIMGDSIFNHMAALLGAILGNPRDKIYSTLGVSIMGRLRQMIFKPEETMSPAEVKIARMEFMNRMNPHGVYAHCHQDHPETPTGVFLRFNPPSHRWGNGINGDGGTTFTVEWMKNSHEKTTEVIFEFQAGEVWRFVIDGYHQGVRCWGFSRRSLMLTADESRTIPLLENYYQGIDNRLVDGYPKVVENWLLGRRQHFLPLEAQEVSLQVFGPWAAALDCSKYPTERIMFHKGQKPFNGGNPDGLIKLY